MQFFPVSFFEFSVEFLFSLLLVSHIKREHFVIGFCVLFLLHRHRHHPHIWLLIV